ncbi:SbcC/MukB-like Walker B domain-containing protein [Demequina mangrovi]|nr:SbcC/MukB-like Walker B domain-containing protein [Demequina mangrovi]
MREAERAARVAAEAVGARTRALEVAQADAALTLAWPEDRGALADADEATLRDRATGLASERAALAGALEAERALPRLDEELTRAREAVISLQGAQAATRQALEALPAEESALRERHEAAMATAARAEDLAVEVERTRAAVQAHAQVAALEKELEGVREAEAEALRAHAEATEAHNALVQRRLRSQAAHLAADLGDGDPCPVCGSTSHPAPAQPSDDHVTDEAVDAAFEVVGARQTGLDAARTRRGDADLALGAAREKAGAGSAEEAQRALDAATAAHEGALTAVRERDRVAADLAALATRESRLRADLDAHGAKVESATASVGAAEKALGSARELASARPASYESTAAFATALDAAAALVTRLAAAARASEESTRAAEQAGVSLTEALAEAGFPDAEAASAVVLDAAALDALAAEVERHRAGLAGAQAVVAELSERDLPDEVADLDALSSEAEAAAIARDGAIEAATAASGRAAAFAQLRREHDELGATTASARAARDVVLTLAESLEGKPPNERRLRLESFVLASKLERIVRAANTRLTTMSSGQYRLEHDDSTQYRNKEAGLALRIADAHTGQSRSTRSLSGGETFLASLSLALGLAETVTAEAGGIELATLFIDEGFGSLDGDTLETAMSTLGELRDAGRTIGVISHVEPMKDAIPAKLEVTKAADGSSRVRATLGDD